MDRPERAAPPRATRLATRRRRDDALAAAEETVRAQEAFLEAAAHELRTPITTIRGIAQIGLRRLRKGDLDPERLERALVTVESQATRLERLVAELLEAAAIARGDAELSGEAVDLAAAAGRAAAELRAAGARVTCRLPAAPVRVRGDADRLALAVAALLDNAARYAPGEGIDIRVDVQRAAASGAESSGSPDSPRAPHPAGQAPAGAAGGRSADDGRPGPPRGPVGRLVVRVAGPGLPPADHGLLFERAHRAASGVARSGAGLGLFLCRQIVELHGGRVGADQPPEGGIRFTALLPLV